MLSKSNKSLIEIKKMMKLNNMFSNPNKLEYLFMKRKIIPTKIGSQIRTESKILLSIISYTLEQLKLLLVKKLSRMQSDKGNQSAFF